MKALPFALSVLTLMLAMPETVLAEPAWGGNCLSCHGVYQSNKLVISGMDAFANPDESATGAPDRGMLPVFEAVQGQTKGLGVQVTGFSTDDRYAVETKRFRNPGVENGGLLTYTGDCVWPEWGDNATYYTNPVIRHRWGTGPTDFEFEVTVGPDAGRDYYDLVFGVAGKTEAGGDLFYAQEHFYLKILLAGDVTDDGDVNLIDYSLFEDCLNGPGVSTLRPGCTATTFSRCDLDSDNDVDLDDYSRLVTHWPVAKAAAPPKSPPAGSDGKVKEQPKKTSAAAPTAP